MNGLALCAGVGGLELGLGLAFDGFHAVCHVEREAFAAAVIVARMEEQALGPAPIWDNLHTFDGTGWRGRVDCITAGFPCQPFSQAGSRLKTDDERWLWPDIERIIGEVGPWLVILENVPGILDGGAAPILGSLAQMGFNAEWGILAAAQVGAPHKRARWFCVAVRPDSLGKLADAHGRHRVEPDTIPGGSRPISSEGQQRFVRGGGRGATVADAISERGCSGNAEWADAMDVDTRGEVRLHDSERIPKEVADANGSQCERARLSERTSTQHSDPGGAGWWAVEPGMGRVVDGLAYRVDRLRACGNGVVPLQAAHAVRSLCERLLERSGG